MRCEILEPSPDRVEPPCPAAGPGRCGGCDFQHVALPAQRVLKAAVIREQFRRLAHLHGTVWSRRHPAPRMGWVGGPGSGSLSIRTAARASTGPGRTPSNP